MDASLCNLVALGSVLSDTERLGDLDIAMELLLKVPEEAELRKSGTGSDMLRESSESLRSSFDRIFWPRRRF
jgi:hypothetical protein